MEDRNNANHPGKPQPYRDGAGEVIPGYAISEAHEEFDNLCKALIHLATEFYVHLGPVKDPQWLGENIVERYEETPRGFISVLLDDDIAEAARLSQWRTNAAKAFSDAFLAAQS